MSFRLVILISGNGSNLQAIIDAIATQQLTAEIACVISDKENAYGLTRAQQHAIPYHVISDVNQALLDQLTQLAPDLIVLAGFMRILPASIVGAFYGKIINIHPSLLPKYPGLHTHQQVFENGDAIHGTTIHFVNQELDAGPIIAQAKLNVQPQETADSLKARVQLLEHALYPKVIQDLAQGRICLKNDQVLVIK